jgi:multicomponent Na+:H+ antiporter subunit D
MALVSPTPRARLAFGAVGTLVLGVVLIGLWPNPLIEAGQRAAADIVDPSRYVEAVGLAGVEP